MRALDGTKERDEREAPQLWNVRRAIYEDLNGLLGAQLGVENSSLFGCKLPHHRDFRLSVYFDTIISSTGSCQVRCASLDVTTILCIVTPHDREGQEAWPYARHERDILTREDKKDQNGLVVAHDGDTLSNPGAYFFL